MQTLTIKDFKKLKNEYYFKLVNSKGEATKTVYFLNGYCRSLKKYSISPFNDINKERFIKSTQLITIDFIF